MKLYLNHIVSVRDDIRSFHDMRFKVTRTIVSYRAENGEEYRKSFEAKGDAIIPKEGTHDELNKLKVQY